MTELDNAHEALREAKSNYEIAEYNFAIAKRALIVAEMRVERAYSAPVSNGDDQGRGK